MYQVNLTYMVYPHQGQPYPVREDRWVSREPTEAQAVCACLENAVLLARSLHGWQTMIELVQIESNCLDSCPACKGRRSAANLEGTVLCRECEGRGYCIKTQL